MFRARQVDGVRRSRWAGWLAAASTAVLVATGQPATAAPAAVPAPISPAVLAAVTDGQTSAFMVYLREQADLSTARGLPADQRARRVYTELTATAQRSQSSVTALLTESKARFTAYWISNVIWVNGDRALLDAIAANPAVERIEPSRTVPLITPAPGTTEATVNAVEWGLANINAPQVWTEYGNTGEGIVVANIDSGVQFDHPALVGKYRGNLGGGTFDHNYNWFDPAGICADPRPCDNNDHGTHTMGTMVGSDGANQIGVAPGAKWIAAKGCEVNTCSDASLLASAQWVLAPTDLNGANPRPELHADIVNNSWGDDFGDDLWYADSVDSWIAAGIFPSFSNGNEGPGCATAGSPGDYPQTYSAGAYDVSNAIASFSSRGASDIDDGIKPNISAPGVNVRSSVPGNAYGSGSGTSMAAPHVSGAVALIWSAAPSVKGDIAATKALLDSTATDTANLTCGGTAADNNVFGQGRLNAYAAVTAAPRGPTGTVTGVVTDAAAAPLAGATVSVGSRSATTSSTGAYTLTAPVGSQLVTAAKFGHHSVTATVTVTEGASVTQNFALTSAPNVTISGKVTDGSGHGWPLYAKIEVPGLPGGSVFTDPFTGNFSVTLPGNTSYQFTTSAKYPGYQTRTVAVVVGGSNQVLNVALPVLPSCVAAGYQVGYGPALLSETFDGSTTPAGWNVVNNGTSTTWAFNDPGARGNLTGGTGGFAVMDSDKAGSGKTQDTDLISPSLDLSGATTPFLRFNSDYRAFSNSVADVDLSIDGGVTWTNVLHQTTSAPRGPRVEQLMLPTAAGAADARLRFHYKGTFAWWWQLDNIEIVNRTCDPVPGGLVAGLTTDATTTTALNGVAVSSVDAPADKAVSAATPDDPNLADGFYWLFSSVTGAHPFAAAKAPYTQVSKSVTVPANGLRRADFALKSGRLTVSPTSVQAFQPYGSVRRTTFTVTNTGTAPATVDLLERDGDFDMLGRSGAPLINNKVDGKLSRSRTGVADQQRPASSAAAADAWTSIADYPVEVYDNAAATGDGKVYAVGAGSGTGDEAAAYVYDPAANSWATLPDMPSERSKPQAAFVAGKLYVLGGWSAAGDPVASVDVFDPVTGSWSTLSGVSNPAARSAAGVGVVDGKIYLVGGCTDDQCAVSDDTVVFDPAAGTFSAGAPYPQDVAWISCGGVAGKVFCAGGSGSDDFANGFGYDPVANSWAPIADLPLDLWGSAGTVAGGLLVLTGGVTAGSTTVTNRTVGYDPAANTWTNLPNAQFAVYRGAAACGAYKLGGSPTSFVGSAESELLAGLENCDEASDVSWLTETPTSFTLGVGKSRTVTLTLTATAAAGVLQPGTYTGQVAIRSNTPYQVPSVDVEMNVSAPAGWGKITGTVLGQNCSGTQVGVPAVVRVNLLATPGVGYTLRADASGGYAYWLPKGDYELIVAKDGWVPEATRLKIEAGIVRTANFVLDPINPCLSGR